MRTFAFKDATPRSFIGIPGSRPALAISFDSLPFPPNKKPVFNFIDLFAGIGGFRLALQDLGGKCVFSSEWDKSAKNTYASNFGEVPFGDINNFTGTALTDEQVEALIPDHDVLAGGFPCQPFSRAGVSARTALGQTHGFACDTQGTLVFNLLRIADVKRPRVLFLENVANFFRHDGGRTFAVVQAAIQDELGYKFAHKVINAQTRVPQKRQRCYMVAFRDAGDAANFNFPEFQGDPIPLFRALERDPPAKYTISDKLWAGHVNRTSRNIARGTGFTAHQADIEKPANTLVARYGKDGKECLVPQKGMNPRKLTPRECANLQGFPATYRLPASDAAAYRQFGNSVAVPVIREIAQQIVAIF